MWADYSMTLWADYDSLSWLCLSELTMTLWSDYVSLSWLWLSELTMTLWADYVSLSWLWLPEMTTLLLCEAERIKWSINSASKSPNYRDSSFSGCCWRHSKRRKPGHLFSKYFWKLFNTLLFDSSSRKNFKFLLGWWCPSQPVTPGKL